MTKPKIALITPSLAKGGIEKVVVVSAKELEKYYDVTVIVMDTFRTDYAYEGKIIDLGLSWEDRRIGKRLINFVKAVYRLRKVKKEARFDLVIGHGELASFPNILSGICPTVSVVHENRLAGKKDLQGRIVNYLMRMFFTHHSVKKIVTVSEGIRESLIRDLDIHKQAIMTIHNPYDIETLKMLSDEHVESHYEKLFSSPVLVAAGRLIPAKGQWYLLRIFAALKERAPGTKLVILGEPASGSDLGEKLITLSRALGLRTYSIWDKEEFNKSFDVYFMGFHNNPFKYMAASRLFAMTSVWEGFGNTIVEAMACGTPVISSDCPSGPGEIIAPELKAKGLSAMEPVEDCGVLMPPFENVWVDADVPLSATEHLWVETLHTLLKDEKKLATLRQRGLKRAGDFHTEIIVEEWKDLIDKILCDERSEGML